MQSEERVYNGTFRREMKGKGKKEQKEERQKERGNE
jgi:hypothetical protein